MIEEKASNEYSEGLVSPDFKDFGSSVGLAIKTGHDDSPSRAGLGTSSSRPSTKGSTRSRTSQMSTWTEKKVSPKLLLSWDGGEKSRANAFVLKKFLKAKGYIIYEHNGGNASSGSGLVPTANSPVSKDLKSDEDGMGMQQSFSTIPEKEKEEDTDKNKDKERGSESKSSRRSKKPQTLSFSASARDPVSIELNDIAQECSVFVACVTREFTFNLDCKKLTLHIRKLVELDKKRAPEMLYVMLDGDFTTESHPYHCRSGWLGYMLRDSLWSPAWSHAHLAGATEAITGVINLRRNKVQLNPDYVEYISSRGKRGLC